MPPTRRAQRDASSPPKAPAASAASAAARKIDPKYLNQPLLPDIVTKKTRSLAADLLRQTEALGQVIARYQEVAEDLEESKDDDAEEGGEVDQAIEEIDQSVREVLDKINDVTNRTRALRTIAEAWKHTEADPDAHAAYTDKTNELNEAYAAKTARAKYGSSKEYEQFRAGIFAARHPDEAQPNVKSWILAEEGDDSDDDIEVAAAKLQTTDPFSLAKLVVPIKQHYLDESSFQEQKKHKAVPFECPVPGCAALWRTYVVDDAFKRRLEQAKARESRKEGTQKRPNAVELEDSDDE